MRPLTGSAVLNWLPTSAVWLGLTREQYQQMIGGRQQDAKDVLRQEHAKAFTREDIKP